MWCPDGFFFVREFYFECANLSFDLSEKPPEWINSLGSLSDAFEAIMEGQRNSTLPEPLRPKKIDPNHLIGREWADIYSEALHHWLLGRLLFEDRYKLFLASQPELCVRVSSEVASFVTGIDLENYHCFPFFPRDPYSVLSLALGGAPSNGRIPRPAYVLSIRDVPEEITNIYHIESQLLANLNGSPLLWKADDGLTPRLALARFVKELNLPPPEQDEKLQTSGKPIHRSILELSAEGFTKHEIAKKFPNLSFRGFLRHWQNAAAIDPQISKPGRK